MSNDIANPGRPVNKDGGPKKTENPVRLGLMIGIGVVLVAVAAIVAFSLGLKAPLPGPGAAGRPGAATAAGGGNTNPWTNTATYGAWQIKCRPKQDPAAGQMCSAVLQVVNQKSHQVLLSWVMGLDAKSQRVTLLQTPSGVLVAKGIDIKFSDTAIHHVNYSVCMPRVCNAPLAMDDTFVKDATAATNAMVTVVGANGKGVQFTIPMTGFDKAVAALK